jgi:hypothetical protein
MFMYVKCCSKGLALDEIVPAQFLISGDDAEVQGAAAAYMPS